MLVVMQGLLFEKQRTVLVNCNIHKEVHVVSYAAGDTPNVLPMSPAAHSSQ